MQGTLFVDTLKVFGIGYAAGFFTMVGITLWVLTRSENKRRARKKSKESNQ